MKKKIGTSSAEPAAAQHKTITELVHETNINPEFAFTAKETTAMMVSPSAATEPPPVATTAAETPVVAPPTEPQHGTSSIHQHRAATHQRSSECRGRLFSEMAQDEKVEFLFSQLQAVACQINRHSEFMSANRNNVLKQQLEINTLKETVERQQVEITQLRAENERLKAADAERAVQLLQIREANNARGIELNRVKEQSIFVQL
ncbi:hypothetical protein Hanom_Chr08g00714501 [Helianthus anomalus]